MADNAPGRHFLLQHTLEQSNVGASPEIRYQWDDWDVLRYYDPPPDQVVEALSQVSHRLKLGFALGTAEFIFHRYRQLSRDPMPIQYCEAGWAGLINWRYVRYEELEDEDWVGPVRSVLNSAVTLIVDTIDCVNNDQHPEFPAASLSALARYILDDVASYDAWSSEILNQMAVLHPFQAADPIGPRSPLSSLTRARESAIPKPIS